MKLSDRNVSVVLDEQGREVLEMAAVHLPNGSAAGVYIEESDDMGLWARIGREDGDHLILIRWEYVLSIDIEAGEPESVGLRI